MHLFGLVRATLRIIGVVMLFGLAIGLTGRVAGGVSFLLRGDIANAANWFWGMINPVQQYQLMTTSGGERWAAPFMSFWMQLFAGVYLAFFNTVLARWLCRGLATKRCSQCGYDLGGLEAKVCPECGSDRC